MYLVQSLFLFLTIASFPLYLFPSGGAQVSHACFVVFYLFFHNAFLAEFRKIPRKSFAALKPLFGFVIATWLIQLCYAIALQSPKMLVFPVFYTFNAVYLLCVYLFIRRCGHKGANVVFLAIAAAVLLVFIGDVLGVSKGARGTSFFNNPNQLGYFTVVTTSLILVFHTKSTVKYSQIISISAILMNLLLSTASLSKAAMISTCVAILLFLPSFKKSQLAIIALVIAAASPIWMEQIAKSDKFDRAVRRLQDIGKQEDDSLLARGYMRFAKNPTYMILTGAGEGEYTRFGTTFEVHSTMASIFFCYGVVGFGLFLTFLFRCFLLSPYLFCVLCFPAFFYGITHNGSRFSYFWLLFAIFFWIAEEQESSGKRLIPVFRYYRKSGSVP